MTTIQSIEHRVFQITTIAVAWCLFYLLLNHPELQLIGPLALWLLSYCSPRLEAARRRVRQKSLRSASSIAAAAQS